MVRQRYEFQRCLFFKQVSLKCHDGLISMLFSPDMSLKERLLTLGPKSFTLDKDKR
jgi:hypothetical protein